MRFILTIFLILSSITGSYAAFIISCPSKNINAINQTCQYTTQVMVNGNVTNQTTFFDVPYFDNLFNATDCVINQVPDNQVFLGNAL
jgi:hypothetical protein